MRACDRSWHALWLSANSSSSPLPPLLTVAIPLSMCSYVCPADPSCNVLVLSLRSGAVGLTLTAATEVFLMEPALNPALTQQAVDRVHRVGQTRPVHVHHLIMADSIEERIMGLTPQLQPQESLEAAAAAAAAATAALGAGRSSRAGPLTKDTRSMRAAELTALFS